MSDFSLLFNRSYWKTRKEVSEEQLSALALDSYRQYNTPRRSFRLEDSFAYQRAFKESYRHHYALGKLGLL